jgi:hypothetical protein
MAKQTRDKGQIDCAGQNTKQKTKDWGTQTPLKISDEFKALEG